MNKSKEQVRESITSGEWALSREQVIRLLSVIDDARNEVLIRLALDLGIRRIDIVAIELKNINFKTNELTYYQKKKRKILVRRMETMTATSIKKYLKKRKEKSVYLFPGVQKKKNHLADRQAYNIFHKYLLKAKIISDINESYPFHSLRATCINLKLEAYEAAIEQGRIKISDIVSVVAKLIDDKPETVRQHYIGLSSDKKKRLATEFQAVPV